MIWQATLASWLLVAGAEAGMGGGLLGEGISRPAVDRRMRQAVTVSLASRGLLDRRQSAAANNGSDTFDPATWDTDTAAACTAALAKLHQSSNPSGACVCYNLPVINNATGRFEADLRLYQVSTPRDAFAGIQASDIQISLSYAGASVKRISESDALAQANSIALAARQVSNSTTAAGSNATASSSTDRIQLLQKFMFEGQVNTNITAGMTVGDIETLVMPVVTLSAKNAAGQIVQTNVTANEAAFLTGAFSREAVISTTGQAQIAVDKLVASLKAGQTAFVLPGYSFMLFPVGLIIYSSILGVGLIAYGIGTYNRIQYAEQFKRAARRTALRK